MAKLTRTNSKNALVESVPTLSRGKNRITIGLTSGESGLSYHLHLSDDEARQLVAFVTERV